jgi:hypothetical protein
VPIYGKCPHCEHPMVVPATARGKGRLCKQCGHGYRAATSRAAIHPLAARSAGDLFRMKRHGYQPVYLIS